MRSKRSAAGRVPTFRPTGGDRGGGVQDREDFHRVAIRRRPVHPSSSLGHPSEQHVLGHRELGNEGYLLRNRLLMPRLMLSAGVRKRTGCSSKKISPASGWYSPVATLVRVDLPEPFSPTSACTSPGRTVRLTPRSACTPGNALSMPSSRSKAGAGRVSGPALDEGNVTRAAHYERSTRSRTSEIGATSP